MYLRNLFLLLVFSVLTIQSFAFVPSDVEKVESFTLKDYNGKTHSLKDYTDSKAIVVIFVSTECPVSIAYNSRMEKIYKSYKEKGIVFLGIMSNKEEPVEEIKTFAKEEGLTFPLLKDEKNLIADKFQASVTPEVYVLDGSLKVLYHGRIDDSRTEKNIKSNDLENALNEVLSAKKVSNQRTKAFGCSIKRMDS